MHKVFIGLGSNLGDRQNAIRTAIDLMQPGIFPVFRSKIYETPPWGFEDQPIFLNQVIEAQTELTPLCLLDELKAIERKIGRKPNIRYGPRLIDLDILFYDNLVLNSQKLIIPHPEIANRAFVLIPLMNLAPSYIHPVFHKKISDLVVLIDSDGITEFRGQGE